MSKHKKKLGFNNLVYSIFPKLGLKLAMARMKEKASSYVKKILIGSFVFSIMLTTLIAWIFLLKLKAILIVGVLCFFLFFLILLNVPNFNIKRIEKEIEGDIFVTGRRLLTLLESGDSLMGSLISVSKSKTKSAKYFSEIISEIYLGKPLEDVIEHAIKLSPSRSLNRILGEIKNSLKTGSGILENLSTTLDDIYKNKVVQIESYGKKLNPLCMFYMIFGTIVPSIGIVMVTLFLSLVQIKITFVLLMVILFFVALIQLFFISLFSKVRPTIGY